MILTFCYFYKLIVNYDFNLVITVRWSVIPLHQCASKQLG